MMTAEERYVRDPILRSMVDHLKQFIAEGVYTPTELREAVILAATQYYSEHPRPIYISAGEFIQAARSLIAKRQSTKEPTAKLFATDRGPSQPFSNLQTQQLSEETIAALNLETNEETFLALLTIMQNQENETPQEVFQHHPDLYVQD